MSSYNEIHKMVQSDVLEEREEAAFLLRKDFLLYNDNKQAWNDLDRLTHDRYGTVRSISAKTVGIVFSYLPEKERALESLIRLSKDKVSKTRNRVANALSLAYPYINNKKLLLECLDTLINDRAKDVRVTANYSMGRISLIKAVEAETEDNFKKELEIALIFFEKSSKEAYLGSPVQFCFPFYQSFYMIIFKMPDLEIEVQKYISKAKKVSYKPIRKKLVEAVEYLVNALRIANETQNFDEIKSTFDLYMRYCEQIAELLDTIEENVPIATKIFRKSLPITDQKIKESLKEIEEKTKKFCKESKETPFVNISKAIYELTKGFREAELIETEIILNEMAIYLRSICRILPEESKEIKCNQLAGIEKSKLLYKVIIINNVLSSISQQIINLQEKLIENEKWIEYFKDNAIQRLDNINFGIFQLKIRSGEIAPELRQIQYELKKLITIKIDLEKIGLNIKDFGNLQHYDTQKLNEGIDTICREIENEIIPKLPKGNDTFYTIQNKIYDLKQSKEEIWFNRAASLASIIGLILTII